MEVSHILNLIQTGFRAGWVRKVIRGSRMEVRGIVMALVGYCRLLPVVFIIFKDSMSSVRIWDDSM